MKQTYDVIIAGLGAMGSAAAYHLAASGKRVLGVDLFTPPHTLGSSHGESRIIREAYFEHPAYVPLVQRAYELWDQLASETHARLFVQTGGLMIGPPDGILVSGARRSAQMHHLTYEELTAAEVAQRSPALRPGASMSAVWEPRAGALFPERCVEAHLQAAGKRGVELRFDETVLRWKAEGAAVQVTTDKGRYTAERLVLTAGSWLPRLVPGFDLRLTVERQVLYWFATQRAEIFQPERCPIYIVEFARGRFFYGFPDLGAGVKVALHHEGEATNPDAVRREVSAEEIVAIRKVIRPFLPELSDQLLRAAVCIYTNTPDEHFLIDTHPEYPQVLIVSPCSGHGFKFSSVIGEIVKDLVTQGTTQFDLQLFKHRAA